MQGRNIYTLKGKGNTMNKQVKVVVVDDNEAVIRSVKEYFRNSEIISVIGGFTNGKDALNYLLQNPDQYDLLMLDLILTQFDGIRIHSGNTAKDTLGCIIIGQNKKKGMVINSRETVDKLYPVIEKACKEQSVTIQIS